MRTYTVQQREGERMGDIDYSYDFLKHYSNYGASEEWKKQRCEEYINRLKEVEKLFKDGKKIQVCNGGYWKDLLDVGMYDGWPYWTETPAFFVKGVFGGEWSFFYNLDDFRIV